MTRPPRAWQPGSRMGTRSSSIDRHTIHIVPSSIKASGNSSLTSHAIHATQSSGNRLKPHVTAGFDDDEMSEDEMNLDSIPSFEMPTSLNKITAVKLELSPVADTPRLANPEISPTHIPTRIDGSDTEDAPERDLIDLDDTESTISSLYPFTSNRLSTSAYSLSSTAPSSTSSINLATPESEDDKPFFKVEQALHYTADPMRTPKAPRNDPYMQEQQVVDNWMEYHPVNDPLPPPAPARAPNSLTLADIAKRKKSKGSGTSALRPNRSNPRGRNENPSIQPLEPRFEDWQSHAAPPTPRGRGGIAVTAEDNWGSPHALAYRTTRPRFGGW